MTATHPDTIWAAQYGNTIAAENNPGSLGGDGMEYISRAAHDAAVSAARKGGMTPDQSKHLPDLVLLAMVGFALLKADRGASEWSHPAIAAFRDDAEPVLLSRRVVAMADAERKWGAP